MITQCGICSGKMKRISQSNLKDGTRYKRYECQKCGERKTTIEIEVSMMKGRGNSCSKQLNISMVEPFFNAIRDLYDESNDLMKNIRGNISSESQKVYDTSVNKDWVNNKRAKVRAGKIKRGKVRV